MSEIELDDWFFNLSSCWQEDITGIKLADAPKDLDYERFDGAVAEWWDSHDYDEKLGIYESENS